MENDFKKINICNGVNFSHIKSSKFKTMRISFTMFLPLDKEWVAKNAILPGILEKSCKSYPTLTELSKKLDDLYGAAIYASVDKLGDFQLLTISASCIDDKFSLDKQNLGKEVARLLKEVIFNPVLEDNEFKDEQVFQERRQLIESIDAEYNDKRRFAKIRCGELMCSKERFGISKYGKREQVQAITSSDVTLAWKRALEKSRIEIMMVGSAGAEGVVEEFKSAFKGIKRECFEEIQTQVIGKAEKVNEYTDVMDVTQSKLVMGFRTPVALPSEDVPAMRVMTALLGGTPTSKLFTNVREKLSLCYYCSARYNKHKGIITIESGVQKENIEKAKKEILNQITQIQKADFTEQQLNDTKIYLCQGFEKIKDSIGSLDDWYVLQSINQKIKSPEEAMNEINNVSMEDVVRVSKSVSLDTVYVLTDGKNR